MTDPGPAIVGRRRILITATAAIVLVAVLLFVITRPDDRGAAGSPSVAPSTSVAPSASGGSPVASSTAIASAAPSATATAGASSSPATPATPAAPTQGPPAATAAPEEEGPLSGRWSGTWTSVAPDTADGTLDIDWIQQGDRLEGTIAMTGTGCPVRGTVQGTVDGENVEFEVPGRDEVKFTGTLTGSTITGTFTQSCDSRAGSFEMKRSVP